MTPNPQQAQLLQQLYSQFIQQGQQQLQQPAPKMPAPQTADDLRMDRLRAALATAGQTLATTPGGFLEGAGAAAGAAAQKNAAMKAGEAEKLKKIAQDDQKARQKLMRSLLGGGGRGSRKALTEYQAHTVQRNKKLDKAKADQDAFNRKMQLEGLIQKDYKARAIDEEFIDPEERERRLQAHKENSARLRKQFGPPSSAPAKSSGKTGTFAQPRLRQPQGDGLEIGRTATNPKTGEKVRWDGKQWVPVSR